MTELQKLYLNLDRYPKSNLTPTSFLDKSQKYSETQIERIKTLETKLNQVIIGQENAAKEVTNKLLISAAGLRAKEKIRASFLFVGPSGVGKTEFVKQLKKLLDLHLIRIDCSELSEKVSPCKLIGATAGYVGYEDSNQLANPVKEHPRSIVLLDEIEKAHKEVFNIFLQIMDYGTLTDSKGNKIDFHDVILIMTSNAGVNEMNSQKTAGFIKQDYNDSPIDQAVKQYFSSEFRGRLDGIIKFSHLKPENMNMIVHKEIDRLYNHLKKKYIKLKVTEKCIQKIASDSYSKEFGARNVQKYIEENISKRLAEEILFGELEYGSRNVIIDWHEDNNFIFNIK